MEETNLNTQLTQGISQLAQVRAAIEEVSEVFGRKDAGGRTPIVVVPKRQNRIRWGLITLGIMAIVGGIVAAAVTESAGLGTLGTVLGLLFIVFGVLRAFYIQIPEGVNALLARG